MHRASVNVSFKRHLPPEPLVQIQNKFTCADPGFFSGGGGGGGGGVQARRPENSLYNVFCLYFFSPQLILQFTERVQNYTFPRIQRGPTVSRGMYFFQGGGGGGQILISLETHIICDFPGGSGPPIPPSGSAHYSHECSS